jgi:hypothetical protein
VILIVCKELIIMLPLHGQNAAALHNIFIGQALTKKLSREVDHVKSLGL